VKVASTLLVKYELVAAAVARTTQSPTPVNVKTAVDESTVQPVEPALVTEYVIAPSPVAVAKLDVFGDCVIVMAVVGAHDTLCEDFDNVKLTAADVAELCVSVCSATAVIEQVPGDTKTTAPDEEPTVHTPVSLLV
jgi:hypothetical protein